MRLKKGDIIKITSYHKPGQWHSIAKKVVETPEFTITTNYYQVLKVRDATHKEWQGYYQVTYKPYTKWGVHDCGFGVTMLHKSGAKVKPYGDEWKIVGFQEVFRPSPPPCLKGNPGYDLMM